MKLSLMVPTFRSAETIERTLGSVLAQRHRPLEVVVYDEASTDGTRELVEGLLRRRRSRDRDPVHHVRRELRAGARVARGAARDHG